jgi:hypothetical protein
MVGFPIAQSRTTSCSGPTREVAKVWKRRSTDQLQGRIGQYNISFDASGRKASEQNLDSATARIQRCHNARCEHPALCEDALQKGTKRGRLVIIDPNNGELLAMASWPTIDPNAFVPFITTEAFRALQDDTDIPLMPRAFRSAYPPGSTFKVFVGVAALAKRQDRVDGRIPLSRRRLRSEPHISKLEEGTCGHAQFRRCADAISAIRGFTRWA